MKWVKIGEYFLFVAVGIAVCYVVGLLMISLISWPLEMMDHDNDVKYCKQVAETRMKLEREDYVLSCYATDDYDVFNNGKDIDCKCFYFSDKSSGRTYFHITDIKEVLK